MVKSLTKRHVKEIVVHIVMERRVPIEGDPLFGSDDEVLRHALIDSLILPYLNCNVITVVDGKVFPEFVG